MKWSKKLSWLLVILVVGLGGIIFWTQSNQSSSQKPAADYQYQVAKPKLVTYYQGAKRWDLKAASIIEPKREEKDSRIILQEIKQGKLFRNGQLSYQLTADKIIYQPQAGQAKLQGNVTLQEVEGLEITTDRLLWSAQEDSLQTTSGVQVNLEAGELTAQEMVVDLNQKEFDFTGQVEMTFEIGGENHQE
ncbi:LPS export ABC transporter periplasmic protein LptC [Halanaerobaculum tunisiense]